MCSHGSHRISSSSIVDWTPKVAYLLGVFDMTGWSEKKSPPWVPLTSLVDPTPKVDLGCHWHDLLVQHQWELPWPSSTRLVDPIPKPATLGVIDITRRSDTKAKLSVIDTTLIKTKGTSLGNIDMTRRSETKASYTQARQMVRKPNAHMCGWDCKPVPSHLRMVRIPFTVIWNLSVFCANTMRTGCAGRPFHALGALCSPQVRGKLINHPPHTNGAACKRHAYVYKAKDTTSDVIDMTDLSDNTNGIYFIYHWQH